MFLLSFSHIQCALGLTVDMRAGVYMDVPHYGDNEAHIYVESANQQEICLLGRHVMVLKQLEGSSILCKLAGV